MTLSPVIEYRNCESNGFKQLRIFCRRRRRLRRTLEFEEKQTTFAIVVVVFPARTCIRR